MSIIRKNINIRWLVKPYIKIRERLVIGMEIKVIAKTKIRKLTDEELGAFSREIAMIMRAGILPSDAIAAMRADCTDSREAEILQKLYEKLETGCPLWEAAESAGVFPDYMLSMMKLGETSGKLQQVCTRLAEHYERLAEISANIRRAVTYPLIMLLLMVIVVTVLTVSVLPIFAGVYNDLGIELTATTMALMHFGEASKWIALAIAILTAFTGLAVLLMTSREKGRDKLRETGAAVFGGKKLAREMALSDLCSAAAMLLAAGETYSGAIKGAMTVVKEKKVLADAQNCLSLLEEGKSLSAAVNTSGLMTGLPAGLLSAGVKAGAAEEAMAEAARRYKENADERIAIAVGRVEPTIVIVLCAMVGLVLLSVMLPLTAIMNSIG